MLQSDTKSKPLTTVDDVIRELGGKREVERLTGVLPAAVRNWKWRGNFPPETYVLFNSLLERKGMTAAPSLWRMQGFS